MYINKVVFVEESDVSSENYEQLRNKNYIWETDYNTVEISSESIQLAYENKDTTSIGILLDWLGEELVNLLKEEKVDFCLVV